MAFIPANHVAQVNLRYLYLGQQCENVYNFQGIGPWDSATLASCAQDVSQWWVTNLQSLTSNSLFHTGWYAVDLTTDAGAYSETTFPVPYQGSLAEPALPGNVTVAVSFRTLLRGRSYRGRAYHLGLTPSQIAGDQLAPAALAALLPAYQLLLTLPLPNGAAFSVVSRQHDGVVATVATVVPYATVTMDPNLDSQRRRLATRGR
jgi:hypothetical protein